MISLPGVLRSAPGKREYAKVFECCYLAAAK